MADQAKITRAAEILSRKIGKSQEEIIKAINEQIKGKSTTEALAIINDTNLPEIMRIKTANAVSGYAAASSELLLSKKAFAPVSEATLTTLLNTSEQYLQGQLLGMSATMKQEIVSGIVNKKTTKEIMESMAKKGYGSQVGLKRIVNDGLNNYSRAVTRTMMEEAPKNLKYVYIGPIDEKTREFCVRAASLGALTLDEINSFSPSSLSEGGGINCRHNWELAATDTKSQFHRGKEAEQKMEAKR